MQNNRKNTHLSAAILQSLAHTNTTQTRLASESGITHAALSRIISRGNRPDPTTLRGLCNSWSSRATGADVLCGHLRDEIERAGYLQREIHIESAAGERAPDDMEEVADRLLAMARRPGRSDVRELLRALAIIFEGLPEDVDLSDGLRVVESSTEYPPPRKHQKKPTKTAEK